MGKDDTVGNPGSVEESGTAEVMLRPLQREQFGPGREFNGEECLKAEDVWFRRSLVSYGKVNLFL